MMSYFFTVSHYILKCFGSLIQHNYSFFMKHGYLRPSFWRSKVILKRSCETTWMCLGIWAWFCCGFCREWAGGIPRAVSHPRYSFEARIFPRCRFLHTTETPMRCPLRILAVADVTWWGFWSRTCHFMSSSFFCKWTVHSVSLPRNSATLSSIPCQHDFIALTVAFLKPETSCLTGAFGPAVIWRQGSEVLPNFGRELWEISHLFVWPSEVTAAKKRSFFWKTQGEVSKIYVKRFH